MQAHPCPTLPQHNPSRALQGQPHLLLSAPRACPPVRSHTPASSPSLILVHTPAAATAGVDAHPVSSTHVPATNFYHTLRYLYRHHSCLQQQQQQQQLTLTSPPPSPLWVPGQAANRSLLPCTLKKTASKPTRSRQAPSLPQRQRHQLLMLLVQLRRVSTAQRFLRTLMMALRAKAGRCMGRAVFPCMRAQRATPQLRRCARPPRTPPNLLTMLPTPPPPATTTTTARGAPLPHQTSA